MTAPPLSLPERVTFVPVALRPFRPDDAPRVRQLCSDPAVALTTALIPHPYLPGMAEEWIATHAGERDAGLAWNYAITRASDHLLVGAIRLADNRAEADSIGYWIGRPFWGNGYATAAARAMVALAFSHLDFEAVTAAHLAANPASGRVMQKCGMALMRRERRTHRGAADAEFCVWTLTREAWERGADA